MASFYSCIEAGIPELLMTGATKLDITYQYEIDTPTDEDEDSVEVAMKLVQDKMLKHIADISGLSSCAAQTQSSDWRRGLRRQLRAGGRGSNSIVGLSSLPNDEIMYNVPCGGALAASAPARGVDDPFENAVEREVLPGFAGSVVRESPVGDDADSAENGQEGDEANSNGEGTNGSDGNNNGNNNEIILSSTVTDGIITSQKVVRMSDNNSNNKKSSEGEMFDNNDNEEGEEEGTVAFNYISTQSLPKESSSHTSHNPLDAPSVFSQRSSEGRVHAGTGYPPTTTSILPIQPRSSNGSGTGSTTTCTVIQGYMSIYISTSADNYENLEDRVLMALSDSVRTNSGAEFVDDYKVLGIRMYGGDEEGTNPVGSSGYHVAGIKGSSLISSENAAMSSPWSFTSNTVPMIILVTLSGVLLLLIGLFVHTSSSPFKRFKIHSTTKSSVSGGKKNGGSEDHNNSEAGTYYDDEVEMDIQEVERDLYPPSSKYTTARDDVDDDGDYSVGQYSISSTSVVPKTFFGRISSDIKAGASPEEIEVDIQSVYDCDESTAASSAQKNNKKAGPFMSLFGAALQKKHHGATATSTACSNESVNSIFTEEASPAQVVNGSKGGNKMRLYDIADNEYLHEKSSTDDGDELDSLVAETRCRVVTPNSNGTSGTDNNKETTDENPSWQMQFFTARQHTPHSEVEACLEPFDDISEYSASVVAPTPTPTKSADPEVNSKYFYNSTADEDRIMLISEHGQKKQPKARIVRKFHNMIKSVKSTTTTANNDEEQDAETSQGGVIDVDIHEIHQIYSYDDKAHDAKLSPARKEQASKKRAPRGPTPVYTMQTGCVGGDVGGCVGGDVGGCVGGDVAKPSTLRPNVFYKSPSSVGRNRISSGVGNIVSPDCGDLTPDQKQAKSLAKLRSLGTQLVEDSLGSPSALCGDVVRCTKDEEKDDEVSNTQNVEADDGSSVAMVVSGNPLCSWTEFESWVPQFWR